MPLTELQVRQAKASGKRYMIRDADGLYLEIMISGNKHWRYRYWREGKEVKVSLGEYPVIGLKEAREKRDDYKRSLAHGIDPRAPKVKVLTFEQVAREWHGQNIIPSKSPQYAYKVITRLEKFLFPHIGARPINELTAPEILTPIRAIEAQKMNETAHTVKQIAGQVFRYAIATGVCDRDPAAELKGALAPVVVKHRAAITRA